MALHTITNKSDLTTLIESSTELLIHLHHEGSLASRTVRNTMISLAEQGSDVAVINIQELNVAADFNVTAVPVVIGFVNGTETNRTVGIQTESFYLDLLKPKKKVSIKLYKTPTCPWCRVAKDHLDKKGVSYDEIDVSQDYAAANYLMQKSGQTGVPQIEIGDEIVVGADVNRIDQLLAKL